jgi:hypothetical protein
VLEAPKLDVDVDVAAGLALKTIKECRCLEDKHWIRLALYRCVRAIKAAQGSG